MQSWKARISEKMHIKLLILKSYLALGQTTSVKPSLNDLISDATHLCMVKSNLALAYTRLLSSVTGSVTAMPLTCT